jgi:hypothetical protein
MLVFDVNRTSLGADLKALFGVNLTPCIVADLKDKLPQVPTAGLITLRDAAKALKDQTPVTDFIAHEADLVAQSREDYGEVVAEMQWQETVTAGFEAGVSVMCISRVAKTV